MQAYYEYVNVCVGTRERMAVLSDHARSWARMENGDPAAGRQAALSATRLDPDLAEGWWTLGECNRKLGRAAEAVPAFQRAVQARPHEWRAHHYLGSCLLEAGHSAEAIPGFDQTKTDYDRTKVWKPFSDRKRSEERRVGKEC